jgi:hypothetical protein
LWTELGPELRTEMWTEIGAEIGGPKFLGGRLQRNRRLCLVDRNSGSFCGPLICQVGAQSGAQFGAQIWGLIRSTIRSSIRSPIRSIKAPCLVLGGPVSIAHPRWGDTWAIVYLFVNRNPNSSRTDLGQIQIVLYPNGDSRTDPAEQPAAASPRRIISSRPKLGQNSAKSRPKTPPTAACALSALPVRAPSVEALKSQ